MKKPYILALDDDLSVLRAGASTSVPKRRTCGR
jgi:hypothetical protein